MPPLNTVLTRRNQRNPHVRRSVNSDAWPVHEGWAARVESPDLRVQKRHLPSGRAALSAPERAPPQQRPTVRRVAVDSPDRNDRSDCADRTGTKRQDRNNRIHPSSGSVKLCRPRSRSLSDAAPAMGWMLDHSGRCRNSASLGPAYLQRPAAHCLRGGFTSG